MLSSRYRPVRLDAFRQACALLYGVETDNLPHTALRGRKARQVYLEQRRENAAVRIQSAWRGASARKAYHADRKSVIIVQACVRRRQARNELKTLRVAAKSASHFKEVSYKLENKVVELTQALQKRTAENKEQQAKVKALEESLQTWVAKYEEAETRVKSVEEEAKRSMVALPEFEALAKQKKEVDLRLEESLKQIADKDSQIEKLMADFQKQTEEIEARQKVLNGTLANGGDDSTTVGTLRAELASLREQLSRAVTLNGPKQSMSSHARGDGPPSFNMATGRPQENGHAANGAAALQGASAKSSRRNRRGSVPQIYPSSDAGQSPLPAYDEFQPRSFSVADYPQDTLRKLAAEEELDPDAIAEEIIRLLEEEKPLDEDVLGSIITNLRIPSPSSSTPPVPKEVLFPAHLISLVTNEMWKYGMLRESERFLATVMQHIQQHVMVGGQFLSLYAVQEFLLMM